MKKYFIGIIVLLSALVLVACNGGTVDTRTVITYAAWNLGNAEDNNIERRLVAAYMEENPDVKIELINRPVSVNDEGQEVESSWFDFFTSRAATNSLPDVYQVADLSGWIQNGWTEDVADLAALDDELQLVPDDVVNAAKYRDYLFALPQARFYMGFFIDRTVISEIVGSVEVEYGITYDELMLAAQKNAKFPLSAGTGVAGISGIGDFIRWLPAQVDETLDWSTFNSETGYHFDSDAFAFAMAETRKYYLPSTATQSKNSWWVVESLTPDDRKAKYGEGDPWSDNAAQSIKWGASYNMRDWYAQTQDPDHARYMHDIDFIGTPSIDGVHKIPTILDFIALGRGTKQREKAYDFAKWMGYGIDGYSKRLEIAEENPEVGAVNFPPLVQDEALVDAYFELYPNMTEYRRVVEEHQGFITESLGKTVPGYWLSAYNAAFNETDNIAATLDKVRDGQLQLIAVAGQLTTIANTQWQNAKQDLEDYLDSID